MHVGGVGGSGAHAEALAKLAETARVPVPANNTATASTVGADTVAGLLDQLSALQISGLIQDIETRRQALIVEPASDLVTRAAVLAHVGDLSGALSTLTELARAYPARAESLVHEASLAPIRPQVETLMQGLSAIAKVDAEQKIEFATRSVQSGGHGNPHRVEMNPQNVIAVAERLVESGRYANVVLAAELAQAVIAYYGPFPVTSSGVGRTGKSARESIEIAGKAVWKLDGLTRVGAQALTRAGNMWRSAPLLLLLTVWMGMGLIAGLLTLVLRELSFTSKMSEVFFDVWGVGFLGLIGFGFYRSIRHLRMR